MQPKSWNPPPVNVRATAFTKVVSARGPLLTYRHKDILWVARAGPDPRAWFLKLDENGRGIGGWIHGRPWLDELLRPLPMILRARDPILSRLRRELKKIRWRSRFPWSEEGHHKEGQPDRERFDPTSIPCLLGFWPKIGEVLTEWETRSATHPYHARFAYARIRKAEHELRSIEAVADWLGHFPPEALAFVERHGFKERRWHLLNLWLRVPEGRELFDEIPALGWMLASSWLFRKPVTKPYRSLRALARKPRSRVLEWLDLPPGEGTLKLLRMLPGCAGEMLPMLHYHAAFRHSVIRGWLFNVGVPLTSEILEAAVPGQISYTLFRAIAHRERMATFGRRDWVSRIYLDTRGMMWGLENEIDPTRLGRIRSTQRLWEFHEELVALQNSRLRNTAPAWEGRKPPPAAPAEWMQALETEEALDTEARELHHCLSSSRYRDAVAEGRYYAYAVFHDQGRATLGIKHEFGDGWRIDQLRGFANGVVDSEVQAEVLTWAKQNRITGEIGTERPLHLGGAAHGLRDVHAAPQRAVLVEHEDDIPF
ncbi:MAG: hypothetical protein AB7I98_02845 [Verrucomicrobiales bacterium]